MFFDNENTYFRGYLTDISTNEKNHRGGPEARYLNFQPVRYNAVNYTKT